MTDPKQDTSLRPSDLPVDWVAVADAMKVKIEEAKAGRDPAVLAARVQAYLEREGGR